MLQWQSLRPGRPPIDISGLFKENIEPFLIELTMVESDPMFEGRERPGKVVEAFRDFAVQKGPPFILLVSDGNYDNGR
jgi:hypothetical protein